MALVAAHTDENCHIMTELLRRIESRLSVAPTRSRATGVEISQLAIKNGTG